MPVLFYQVLCALAAVALTHFTVPAIGHRRVYTYYQYFCGDVAARLLRMPIGNDEHDEPFDLYQIGDTTTEHYDGGMHLWVAFALGFCFPLLPLARNPFGMAGLLGLTVLFAHLFTIDFGEFRLPNVLTQSCMLLALGTVLLSGFFGGFPDGRQSMTNALIGGVAVLGLYLLLWVIQPGKLGWGDVQLSTTVGLLLGWNGMTILAYGFAAAWVVQGLVSIALLMVRITSMKALLPLGPAIITTTVLVPVMLVA